MNIIEIGVGLAVATSILVGICALAEVVLAIAKYGRR